MRAPEHQSRFLLRRVDISFMMPWTCLARGHPFAVLGVMLVVVVRLRADGGCDGAWVPSTWGGAPGPLGTVTATTTFDDGSGPRLYAVGRFNTAGDQVARNIASWDAAAWRPVGAGIELDIFGSSTARAPLLLGWNPAGPLAASRLLMVADKVRLAGAPEFGRVVAWNGTAWRDISAGLTRDVQALFLWDSDGDGDEPSRPTAIASVDQPNFTRRTRVFQWDGEVWRPFGGTPEVSDTPGAFIDAHAWDPDGAGPLPEAIVGLGGYSTSQQDPPAVMFDGTAWQPLNGAPERGLGMTVFDPDGEGPAAAELYIATIRSAELSTEVVEVWKRESPTWVRIGGSLGDRRALTLRMWDADGPGGPLPPELHAVGPLDYSPLSGGTFVQRFRAGAWGPIEPSLVGGGLGAFGESTPTPESGAKRLIVVGAVRSESGDLGGLGAWNGQTWERFGAGFFGEVRATVLWRVPGDAVDSVIVAGDFVLPGTPAIARVAKRIGGGWAPLGAGLPSAVDALAVWGSPGTLGNGRLVAGLSNGRVVAFDGVAWSDVGTQANGAIRCLVSWDADAEGPGEAELYAGGSFTRFGTTTFNYIARWDGLAWRRAGTPISPEGGAVYAMTPWDPDGPGPEVEVLAVGGRFHQVSGFAVPGTAFLSGGTWEPIGEVLSYGADTVRALTTWDPDGNGPAIPLLISTGMREYPGSFDDPLGVRAWTGSVWQGLGAYVSHENDVNDPYMGLGTFDRDGDGPLPADLIAYGKFVSTGLRPDRGPLGSIARFDGTTWKSFGAATDLAIRSAVPVPAPHGAPSELLICGPFNTAGGLSSARVAIWRVGGSPIITTQPLDQRLCLGRSGIQLSARAAVSSPAMCQWTRNGTALTDGPLPSGAMVSGATSPDLLISLAGRDEAGMYRCDITDECGAVASRVALVSRCDADVDCDGVAALADLLEFLRLFFIASPAADFDMSGVLGVQDVFSFLESYFAPCAG